MVTFLPSVEPFWSFTDGKNPDATEADAGHALDRKKTTLQHWFGDGAATAPRPTTPPIRTNREFSEGTQRDSSVSLNAGEEGCNDSVGLELTLPCPIVETPDMGCYDVRGVEALH